jgi:uncharacterized protein Yka (UPF0111/DUF47 family)
MIKLDDNFRIETDTHNWTLVYEEQTVATSGKHIGKTVTSKDEWHYPSIVPCLKKYLDESLKYCESIMEILERIGELEQRFETDNAKKVA